ncbi:MAG: MlaD family protein [Alphaproteobacteria bacterium]|jgi:phospholipid/cholesterol/gamma-HCH transport system substrate-binding protein|nr:MCE family protein [Rhodospirillaceae bacterium]MBT6510196.1 MCE family protein [Rhodospirillaceae bacterium]MBT7613316.1 MCE family protein [Rhodospirillaceae bacterium]MDG2480187.1 MlaD family protein [Alphaproteobacteria bacterium]
METRASYTLVGTFVLIMMLGLAGFVIWLAKFSSDVKYDDYQMFVTGSVTGLSNDATVRYSGIPVGNVTDIRIAPDNIDQVRITVQIEATTPVRTDTVASVEMQGITGVAYIELTGGSHSAERLVPGPGEKVATIKTEESALAAVFASAPDMINSAIELMNRGSAILSDKNQASVTNILADASEITNEVAEHKDAIGSMIEDAQETLASVQGTTANVEKITADLSTDVVSLIDDAKLTLESLRTTLATADRTLTNAEPDIQETLDNLKLAAASIRGAADTAQQILQTNQAPINEFSEIGLFELTQLITDARTLVSSLTQIAIQLERDPAAFLFGGNQAGYQAN